MRKLRPTRLDTLRRLTASASAMALLLASTAQAAPVLPSGGAVAAGTASITQPAPGGALIVQQSQKAVINWQNFSIGAGASVTFQQPNASAITLNRVVGPDASAINGNLTANGQVWLLNGNGILFGKGSSINVGGLIATTSDLKDGDFLSGNYAFSGASANSNAAVVNQGSIKAATGGAVVLSGARVVNDGAIKARLGKVVLGGASAFSVDFDGDNLIRYQVTAPVSQTPNGPDGKPAAALVSNSGTIAAAGGTVTMTARAARNVVDNVINSSGIIEAKSASVRNGEVILDAGDGGTVRVAGSIDVSGIKTGQTGGAITVIGGTVAVADGAKLNASGDAGGGTVLVGGDLHGAGPLPNAQTVSVGNAVIAADAITSGKGGTVAITSTGQTNVAAAISAQGGAVSGDGGTVETSGANLDVTGVHVNASAAAGASGLWLLDPTNVNIDSTMAATIVGELDDSHTDVSVTAPGGSINVNAPVIYNSANSLTLLAGSSLTFNASVQNSGSGAIFGVAGWDGVTSAANILTTPGAYGLNNVVIGTDSASGGVAVGSLAGATTIAGYDLVLAASSGYAQLGYHGSAGSGTATGAITVELVADLILGGGGTGKYAQVGHGSNQQFNDSNAPITVTAAGTVHMAGGSGGGAYALIGNGGFGGGGSQAGNITVSAGANVVMAGGSGSLDSAQIGNSGSAIGGTVLLASAGDITLGTGSSINASAAGDALVLAAGHNIINQAGSGVFNVSGGGRWLAFLNDPSNNQTGLSASPFYNRVFDFLTDTYAAVTSAGNRFVYALAPTVTIVIDNKSKAYGSANPTLTATITGGQPGSVYTGAPALSTTATDHSNVGDYAITGTLGTLVSDFNYAFQFVNGVLHIDPAALTASLTGTVQKVYDGTLTAAPAAANYQFIGLAPGDSVSLNDPLGTYDTKNAGSGKTVSVSGLALVGANKDNYVLTSTNASGNVGTITAATLAASLSGTVQKTYDGNTAATLTSGNYQLSGVISEDSVTLNNPSGGTYDTKNVGSGKTVSVSGLALQGTDKNNYVLASTSISGAVGEIDVATLTAALSGMVQKTYDGNTGATLTSDNYQLSGVASEDSVTLNNPSSGAYDTKNVGSGKTVNVGGLALQGTDKNNYVLASTSISGAVGEIDAATLTASLTGTVQKTYDGNTGATLTSGNYQLSGVISEDNVTLNNPASGLYDTKNVGSEKTVSVGGLALQGADKNNYVLASTSISGAVGEIDAATLTASLTGTVQKPYDGNASATLAVGNYQLAGVVSGDSVTLNNPANGAYDTPDAGTGKTVSVSGLALLGSDRNNYVLASSNISANIGVIGAILLTASLTGTVQKTYDGTTAATLAAGNYQLAGVVSGDSVGLNDPSSGLYDTRNAGSGKTVNVSGLALQGADKNNYVLASTSISGAVGTITAATLTASLTGTVQKTYDGTTAAALAAGNYRLSGVISEDNVTLNNPASGSYDTRNVGSEKTVSVSGLALQGADKGNYVLASSNISAAIGSINAATLTASLTGTVQKVYDGTVSAVLTASNYLLAGAVSGDSVTLNNPSAGTFDTRNVGAGKTVSVSGVALQGADKGNYVLASSNISAAIGSITAATLTASLTGTVQKTYDGTTTAALAAGNYQLAGAISGDSVSLNTPVAGTFDTKNVGAGKTVSVGGLALQGADKGNYVLASSNISAAIGTITAATLTASLTGSVQKTYDGTTTATLVAGNFQFAGLVSGDSVSLSAPTGGSYDNKNAGSGKTVSVNGVALQGADKGNYVLASSNLSAAIGTITPATLTASLTGTVQKVYDGAVSAILAATNYLLSGALGGDSVSLNNPSNGNYASADAGTGKTVSVNGLVLQGADQGNYVLASSTISAPIGTITPSQTTPDVVQILGNTFTSGSVSGPQSPVAPTAPPAAAPSTSGGGSQTSSTSSDATYATASGGDTPAPSDAAASKVGQSLSGAPGGVPSSTYVVIQGLLRQFSPPPGGARPHGVPPFGQVYSSWGNEAFWQ